jgi:hypothetical protein
MDRLETLAQTYNQAPWRNQLRIIGLFSLILVLIALVAGIYLTVSARSAAVGRSIQKSQRDLSRLDREIEDLQSQLAIILSSREMQLRAEYLGYQPIISEQIVYLDIPGYTARQTAQLAPASQRNPPPAPVMPPQYTESLLVWLRRTADRSYQMIGLEP